MHSDLHFCTLSVSSVTSGATASALPPRTPPPFALRIQAQHVLWLTRMLILCPVSVLCLVLSTGMSALAWVSVEHPVVYMSEIVNSSPVFSDKIENDAKRRSGMILQPPRIHACTQLDHTCVRAHEHNLTTTYRLCTHLSAKSLLSCDLYITVYMFTGCVQECLLHATLHDAMPSCCMTPCRA
jgi:hypothetical protein